MLSNTTTIFFPREQSKDSAPPTLSTSMSHPVFQALILFFLLLTLGSWFPLHSQEVCELTLHDPVLSTISLERNGNLQLE